jgi:protein-S-isoprenylcysteine O-methyltransferase Ste14
VSDLRDSRGNYEMQKPVSLMERWQKIARRIRVPLGFVTAGLYLWQLWLHAPQWKPIAWSLLLVAPGLWLRAYASGYVKKNRELTVTGPYAHVRNPLYLGSILIAAGFAVALMSWQFAVALAVFFLLIYVPVIASEEAFLRETFLEFEWYCARVPRLVPRLTPVRTPYPSESDGGKGGFALELYRKHREYNSAIGAALLYGSLVLGIVLHGKLGHP